MRTEDLKIFSNIPTIRTERLVLRKITPADLIDVYEYSKNPETSKFLLWSKHNSLNDTKILLSIIKRKYKENAFYEWGIEYNGKMIGTAGFTHFSIANDSAEIGYVINPDYQGIGIATEAARAVIDFGFNTLNLNRIEARCMKGNDKSIRVMEKCGMKVEGTMRSLIYAKGNYVDVVIAAIIGNEYANWDKR